MRGGWTQLVGAAYERRIYAFRFDTTPAQDNALMARLNPGPIARTSTASTTTVLTCPRRVINSYFPRTFRRTIFPDAGMTTPKQITYKLVEYARKHPGDGSGGI